MSLKQARKQTLLSKSRIVNDSLTCKPLDNLSDIHAFLDYPPPWRTLCKELVPRSKFVIRNIEHRPSCEPVLESPEIFCHIDPDTEAPVRYDVTKHKLPKTLVCHDMANGYHDDSKIEGTQAYDAYTFYNWAGIDIFCYFSHHLITIPPVSWISVGHAHGVKVIGTIITEWGEGAQLWDTVLSSEMEYRNFASAVVAIAKTMKFDGYLLNIENKISKPDDLFNFVRYLHKLLHEELVDPVLIWYDSVTITGNLNWQNGLNAKNRAFFDICDGFFTNYSWSVKDVQSSAAEAGDRVTDLYIGIDVWGRNFFGGGQFNVQAAVQVAHAEGCSLAIFAPAWTREAMSGAGVNLSIPEHFTAYEEFLLRDRALWDSVWPYLNTHLPCHLPFHTSFCRGQGRKRWMYGEVISPGPWYNLRHQQYQPNCNHGPHGYVMSTVDNIARLSWAIREDKGILKYRRDLENIRSSTFINTKSAETHHHHADTHHHDGNERDEESFQDIRFVKKRESFIKFQDMSNEEHDASLATEPQPDADTETQADHQVPPVDAEPPSQKLKSKPSFKKIFVEKLKTIFKKGGPKSETENNTIAGTSALIDANSADQAPSDATDSKTSPAVTAEASGVDLRTSMVKMSVNVNLMASESKTRWALAHVAAERECLSWWGDDAFCGGASLKVNPSDTINTDHRTIRLFHCDFQCQDTLIVCVVTKDLVQSSDQYLNVKLVMVNASGQGLTVVLMGRSLGLATVINKESTGIVFAYPIYSEQQEAFRGLREYLLLHEPGFYVPVENLYGWEVRYYEVCVPGARVAEVNCRTGLPQGGILLGHLGICHRNNSGKSEFYNR